MGDIEKHTIPDGLQKFPNFVIFRQALFNDGELIENVVCRNFPLTTQHGAIEGKTQEKEVKYYKFF